MVKAKNDYERYMDDILKISSISRFIYGKRDKDTLSHLENYMSLEYLEKIKELNFKYKYTKDIQLKEQLENEEFYINNKFYLLIFSSYVNFIINFMYDNSFIYPKNKIYKKSREHDFSLIINSSIERAKDGLKENITFPKIIIKKFLNQIKDLSQYKYFYDFIKKEYYPHCRNEIGLCYLPNGKNAYKILIKDYLGYLDITPEEIHDIGKKLVVKPIKLGETYKSKKELMNDCYKYAKHIYDNIIDKYFDYKPKTKFILTAVPKSLESSSPLGYYNDIENKVFVNLSYYYEVDKKELYSFIMHECMHFYHYEYMKYMKVPKYKMYNFSNIALVEGFAHYMETYCEDYDDENNSFALLRKVRLVVDTGINYFGWTYKQAYEYMDKYMPKKKTDNINEIDRYICMPGQALCYLIGKLHIIKLRDDYLNKNKGTIKDFHRELLVEGLASFTIINKKFEYNNGYTK
jgi:uncharacterized protein (DUF885 family)